MRVSNEELDHLLQDPQPVGYFLKSCLDLRDLRAAVREAVKEFCDSGQRSIEISEEFFALMDKLRELVEVKK